MISKCSKEHKTCRKMLRSMQTRARDVIKLYHGFLDKLCEGDRTAHPKISLEEPRPVLGIARRVQRDLREETMAETWFREEMNSERTREEAWTHEDSVKG